jgi:hypothetical protein
MRLTIERQSLQSETRPMPNRAIAIRDSVLAGVSLSQDEVQLHFSSTYIHQSEGVTGRDPGSGWVQEAILRVHDGKVEGAFSEFPVILSDGQTHLGQNILNNEIPVPLDHEGTFQLRLEAWRQEKEIVTVTGSGAELELLGEPHYVEEYPG